MKRFEVIMILAAAFIFALSCGSKNNQNTTGASKTKALAAKLVKVQAVKQRKMIEKLELPGTIQPENVANILSTAEGKISKLFVREGDEVKQDEVVVLISSLVREDIINSSRLLVETKKKALEKKPNDLKLQQELQQAEQDYQFALQQYKVIPVTSPISGVVSKRMVDLGDMIPAKAKLFEIQSSKRFRIDMPVSELDFRKLHFGQLAEIHADACPEKTFRGKIQRIHPLIDTKTRNGLVEIHLTAPCPNLRAGMFVRVTFIIRTLENSIAIPVHSIIDRPENKTCFIVKNGKAQEVVVRTGLEAEGWVEILSGIKVGNQVVIEGQQQLKTGTPVKIQGAKKKSD